MAPSAAFAESKFLSLLSLTGPVFVVNKFKEILKDRVKDVRITHRLTDSPACLVADENASASDKLGKSSQNLASLAEELNNLVSQFKY